MEYYVKQYKMNIGEKKHLCVFKEISHPLVVI